MFVIFNGVLRPIKDGKILHQDWTGDPNGDLGEHMALHLPPLSMFYKHLPH